MAKVTKINSFLSNDESIRKSVSTKILEANNRYKVITEHASLDAIEDICWGPHGMTQSRFLKSVMLYICDLYGDYSEASINANEQTKIKYNVVFDSKSNTEIESTRGKHSEFYKGFLFAGRELKIAQSKLSFGSGAWHTKNTSWLNGYIEGCRVVTSEKKSPYLKGALTAYEGPSELIDPQEASTLEDILFIDGNNAIVEILELTS